MVQLAVPHTESQGLHSVLSDGAITVLEPAGEWPHCHSCPHWCFQALFVLAVAHGCLSRGKACCHAQPSELQFGWAPGMLWVGTASSSDSVALLSPSSAAFPHQPSWLAEGLQ